MIDYATEIRQAFIHGVDQTEYERMTLETRRYLAQEYLRRRGMLIIERGNTWRPNWGEPDPRFKSYARGA